MSAPLHLDAHELECLRQLAARPDGARLTCRDALLDHLVALGLLQKVLALALPVVPPRYTYRITALGQRVLHERGGGC